MPTVPNVTGPSVGIAALPAARVRTQPDLRGGFAVADALGKAANVAGEVYQQQKQAVDEAAVFEARTKLADWENEWFRPDNENGVYGKRGKAANELHDTLFPDFERNVGEIEAGLSNDAQRQAFRRVAFGFGEELRGRVGTYVRRENDTYLEQVAEASRASMIQRASSAAREGRYDVMGREVDLAHAQLDMEGQRRGLPPEVVDQQKQAFTSAALVAAINGKLETGDYRGAASFYRDNADLLVESDRARLDNVVRNADLLDRETSEANRIMGEFGTGTEAVRRAESITDPVLRDRVVANIDREAARRERAENQRQKALKEQAYSAVFGADAALPIEQAVAPNVLAQMDPEDVVALQGFQDRRLRNLESRTDPRVYERLATLPAADLAKVNIDDHYVRGELSLNDRNSLLKRQEEMNDPEKAPRWGSEDDMMREAFGVMGLAPSGKRDEARRGDFRMRYAEAEREAVRQKGKALTNEEQWKLVNDLMLQVTRTKPGLLWDSTETRRLYEVPDGERAGYTVPAAVRQQITAAFRERGIENPSEAQIRSVYAREAERFNRMTTED